ncbi:MULTISPECIES: hypothetical protein [unclassified Anabaena]|uniref:hypothetical protein n=1 Tax=unclassified Anabaena TaxID=2619674 RepID=UPI0014472BA9|nr:MULTISPECIES: hypothetical protein [unclassified Anabaena]MTJ10909.1 hypothetical protein [Anabaena sp. UHCC 0204]MTJ51865.1 hypothetical protein [Anabaena sp. UHCC 0253]
METQNNENPTPTKTLQQEYQEALLNSGIEAASLQDLRNWHRRSLYYSIFVLKQVTQLAQIVGGLRGSKAAN